MILMYFIRNLFLLVALPGDVELMVRMKETIDGQRDELRQLNGEVQSQKREVDAVSTRSLCPKAAYTPCLAVTMSTDKLPDWLEPLVKVEN